MHCSEKYRLVTINYACGDQEMTYGQGFKGYFDICWIKEWIYEKNKSDIVKSLESLEWMYLVGSELDEEAIAAKTCGTT